MMATHRQYLAKKLEDIAATGKHPDEVEVTERCLMFVSDRHYHAIATSLEFVECVHREEGMAKAWIAYLDFVTTPYMMDVFEFIVDSYKGGPMSPDEALEVSDKVVEVGKELGLVE